MNHDDNQLFNVQSTPAPDFAGIAAWINSKPLHMSELKGKVVLVDFWTYTCVNCVRTLPHVEKWYETYKDKDFIVVGVHAPEFAFEHDENNVRKAVADRHVTYPVALDNDYGTWNAYDNHYWPAHYLIDKQGSIRRVHFGEGAYDETERAIQKLLGEEGPLASLPDMAVSRADLTPETYFGSERANGYSGKPDLANVTTAFTAAEKLAPHHWTLDGQWQVSNEEITSQSDNSKLRFHVKAKDVYVVVSHAQAKAQQVTIEADDSGTWYGGDDPNGILQVNKSTIYHIASFGSFAEATLTLTVPAGLSLHTFTFGG
jgi:thiol-disulfide isomerase/thioredoxin